MKKAVLAVLLAISSGVALAGGVGAQNPQLAGSASSFMEVAIAETGASFSWAVLPFSSKANAHQLAELKSQVETINQSINSELEAVIERKLLNSLEY